MNKFEEIHSNDDEKDGDDDKDDKGNGGDGNDDCTVKMERGLGTPVLK